MFDRTLQIARNQFPDTIFKFTTKNCTLPKSFLQFYLFRRLLFIYYSSYGYYTCYMYAIIPLWVVSYLYSTGTENETNVFTAECELNGKFNTISSVLFRTKNTYRNIIFRELTRNTSKE